MMHIKEHDAGEFEDQVKGLEDELHREKERYKKLHVELLQKTNEITAAKQKADEATAAFNEQIKLKDALITKLKRQLTIKGTFLHVLPPPACTSFV